MADEHIPQFSAPTWLRDLGFSSWLLVGFVLIIVGLIWLLGETSTIVMPVILAAVLGAVAGPAVGWLERHRVPRIGGAILVLLGLVAIGVLIFCLVFGGISANSGDISAKMNQSLDKIQGWFERRRRGQRAERHGGRAEGRAGDPHDAAERGRGGHRGPQVAGVLPRLRDPQHAVRAQGRAGHAPLHQPAPGRARAGRQHRHDQRRQVAAQLLPRRDDHRRVQRRPDRGRGADPRRAARGDDRRRHVRGGLRALRRRLGRRRLRRADRAQHREHVGRADHGGRRPARQRHAPADDPAVRDGRDPEPQPARGARRHDRRRLPVRDGRADARRPADLRGRAHRQRAGVPQRRRGARPAGAVRPSRLAPAGVRSASAGAAAAGPPWSSSASPRGCRARSRRRGWGPAVPRGATGGG